MRVDPVIVVYALRYALPRASGALGDVCAVIRSNWPELRYFAPTIEREVREALAEAANETTGWAALRRPEHQAMRDLLAFIDSDANPLALSPLQEKNP